MENFKEDCIKWLHEFNYILIGGNGENYLIFMNKAYSIDNPYPMIQCEYNNLGGKWADIVIGTPDKIYSIQKRISLGDENINEHIETMKNHVEKLK